MATSRKGGTRGKIVGPNGETLPKASKAKPGAKARPDLVELGKTGLQQYSGRIYEEILPELSGVRWQKIIKQMAEGDPIIGAVLYAIEMLMRAADWNITPASEALEDKGNAEFVEQCLFTDMSQTWQDTLAEILTYLPWGWSYLEIVYKQRLGGDESGPPERRSKYNDGRIGWRKWSIRAQDSLLKWEFDDAGGIQALTQMPAPDFVVRTIPIDKALLFRTTTRKGNPEGRSLLRNAYGSWYFKTNIARIEGIGIERDLAGLPVAWVPPELLSSDRTPAQAILFDAIVKLVTRIRRDEEEGIVYPMAYDENGNKIYDLTLMSTAGQRQFDTDKIINRYDKKIAMTVLGDFILLGQDRVGSFALSKVKTNLFNIALGAAMDSICNVINRYAIPRLMKLNGLPTDAMPSLTHGDIDAVDLDSLSKYITALAGAQFPLVNVPGLQNYLLEQANMPVAIAEGDRT